MSNNGLQRDKEWEEQDYFQQEYGLEDGFLNPIIFPPLSPPLPHEILLVEYLYTEHYVRHFQSTILFKPHNSQPIFFLSSFSFKQVFI